MLNYTLNSVSELIEKGIAPLVIIQTDDKNLKKKRKNSLHATKQFNVRVYYDQAQWLNIFYSFWQMKKIERKKKKNTATQMQKW